MKIITISETTKLRDELQRRLPNLLVVNAVSVEAVGEIAKKNEPVGAIVVELETSVDRMSFEFIRVAFQMVPKILILNIEDEETTDLTEIARNYDATSVFPSPVVKEQFDTMANIISSFVQNQSSGKSMDPSANPEPPEFLYRRFRAQIQEIEKELNRLADETIPFITPHSGIDPKEKGWLTEQNLEQISQIRVQLENIGIAHAK